MDGMSIGNTKKSAACKSFYVIAKKEPLIPLIWFEASLNSFK